MKSQIKVNFEADSPIAVEVNCIEHYSVHRHQDVLEILFVLQGALDVKMSFEHFILNTGEFVLINHEDFHSIKAVDQNNVVVSLFINLKFYEKYFKSIKYITFISEFESYSVEGSYSKQVLEVRNLVASILNEFCFKNPGHNEKAGNLAYHLIASLVNNFNEVNYYNKAIKPNSLKMDRYYLIRKYLDEQYKDKDLLKNISNNEFFSKSYISHLFKDVATFSIQDIVCYLRNWKSEELLLTTKMSISEISAECGYSDPKYYYKHFKKWYQCTPSEFRQMYEEDLHIKNSYYEFDLKNSLSLLDPYLEPSIGIEWQEPLTQNLSKNDFKEDENTDCAFIFIFDEQMLPVISRKNNEIVYDWDCLSATIRAIEKKNLKLCAGIDYNTRAIEEWKAIFNQCIAEYGKKLLENWEFWIIYREADTLTEIRSFISELKNQIPDIMIQTVLRYKG